MNFYAVLGIPPDADENAIRTAYRALARRYHPDAGAGASTERFREVTEAYETLSDPRRREVYDLAFPYSRRSATVRAEPMTAPPGFFFGPRWEGRIDRRYSELVFEQIIEDVFRSFDELFFFL